MSWESPDNTPFTKAIRNVLVGDQLVPFCLELSGFKTQSLAFWKLNLRYTGIVGHSSAISLSVGMMGA